MVVAAASGVPPHYILDIPEAEAWALLQASAYAAATSEFRSDCNPCVDAINVGRACACVTNRPLARVFTLLFDLMERQGHEARAFVWMPAHTKAREVGRRRLSNGQPLSATDRLGNALADRQAKAAAMQFDAGDQIFLQVKAAL